MDTVMAHYGGLPPDVSFSSLHDVLLNDLHETVCCRLRSRSAHSERIFVVPAKAVLPDMFA